MRVTGYFCQFSTRRIYEIMIGEVNILTSYLNPKKYTNQNKFKEQYYLIRIDSDFLNNEQNPNSENVTKEVKSSLPTTFGGDGTDAYKLINTDLPLVVTQDGDEVNCYFKREEDGIITYLSLEDALLPNTNESHYLPYNELTFIDVELGASYYYHVTQEQLYILINVLPEIILLGQKFLNYNPKYLGGLKDGAYELDYKNAKGYTNSVSDQILGILEQGGSAHKLRVVNVSLYPQAGKVYWYPKIIYTNGKITLHYEYHKILNDHFDIPIGEDGKFQPAIKLEFDYVEGFLAFMVLTYFLNGVSPLDVWEGSGFRKKDFFKQYVEIIVKYLKLNEDHIYGVLTILYYVPQDFFVRKQTLFSNNSYAEFLGEEFIWSAIQSVLKVPVSNFTVNVEDITVKLLRILIFIQGHKGYKNPKDKNDYILNELLRRRFQNQSYLIAFYDRMDTSNFVSYNYLIYKIWRNSSYVSPKHPVFENTSYVTKFTDVEEKDKKSAPLMLPYKSNKVVGFYTSNIDTEFTDTENIIFTPDSSILDDAFEFFYGEERSRGVTAWIEGNWKITYHPLHPIYLPNPTEKSAIKVQRVSPALLIKASEDKAFWSNVGTTVSYTFDALTTLSGIGNLAKFRHLARIADAAGYLKNGIKLKNSFYVYKAATGTLATVEISSGTINILLRITGLEDTPFGKALTNFLFWMEMLTLSVDLYDAIEDGLRASAKILTEPKQSSILSNKLDEFIKARFIDEADKARILDEVEEIAGKKRLKISDDFIETYGEKTLKNIDINLVLENMKGITNEADMIIKYIEDDVINVHILDDITFDNILREEGYPEDIIFRTTAMADLHIYLRDSSFVERVFGEIVHEGIHAVDYNKIYEMVREGKTLEEIIVSFGSSHDFEMRAYLAEQKFQKEAGLKIDHKDYFAIVEHIEDSYEEMIFIEEVIEEIISLKNKEQ
jgi:hypothetical protein